jgi:GWxTD domain-containing protein
MTPLESWVHTPLAQSPLAQSELARTVSFALAHSLWEGLLIAVVLAAALCVARSSRARYGAACVAMLFQLASFGVTLVRLLPQPMDLSTAPHASGIPAAPTGLPIVPVEAPPAPASLAAWFPWIASCWAAGVLFFHLRSLGGWIAARRLRQSGVCHAPGEWQQRLDGLAARVRVSKPAALLESCLADVPVVIGYVRPVILMPVGLLAGLPVAQMEAILIHELAHIRRQDYLVNLMQTFVEGLLFYHPAVWWISGVIRAERENCCDDLAVAATGDARQYAAALAALEQNRWAAHELALAATGGSLVKRIRRLLQQPERPRAAWTPVFSASLMVAGAGIALASWQTTPAPKPPAPVPAASAVPAAPVTVELPAAPPRKPARPILIAQALQTPPAPQASQSVEQQLRDALQREDTAPTNLATPYKKWLNEDVAYIITDEERKTFKKLTTDAEREQFITQFWLRRDPTPGTPENEFKAEHYRRIAYANEQYATSSIPSLPGWKTDRGRIYITFGPPDEIDDHSSGGAYVRPAEEGGGTTSTFPFQQWRYRYIDGIGNNVVVEFVDPTYTKEYRMTMDPSEKDALRFVSLSQPPQVKAGESNPAQVKALMAGRGQPTAAVPNSASVFVSVGEGPKVTVAVTSAKMNTQVSVALPSTSGKYDVIARITDVNNKAVANLRDVTATGQLNYMSGFVIKPGSYTLTLVTRDQASGVMQASTVNFYVN